MPEERGVIETIREAVERYKEAPDHNTCDRVTNRTNTEMRVCVTEPQSGDAPDKHHVEILAPRETLQVDPRHHDIEGILHENGSATKFPGILGDDQSGRSIAEFFGWTAEIDAAEVAHDWPECAGQAGKTVPPPNHLFLVNEIPRDTDLFTFVRVDSSNTGWHESRGLQPNSQYRVIPRTSDRWTVNAGASFDDFHGGYSHGGFMNGVEIGIPKSRIPIGGVIILVWDVQDDGSSVPNILDFPVGVNAVSFRTGQNGGSIHFLIADKQGTYADNFGECVVAVARIP